MILDRGPSHEVDVDVEVDVAVEVQVDVEFDVAVDAEVDVEVDVYVEVDVDVHADVHVDVVYTSYMICSWAAPGSKNPGGFEVTCKCYRFLGGCWVESSGRIRSDLKIL